jgi:cysteine desulfurase
VTIYLDNNATTRPAPSVVTAMDEMLRERWANPSSIHRPGQEARQRIELAREQVAKLLGCRDRDVIFTSGGTESMNLAVFGSLSERRNVLVTSRIEHSAVREAAEAADRRGAAEVVWIDAGRDGLVDLDTLRDVISRRADEIALVSIMWVNNETGVIQPIEDIGAICREHNVRFHTDAVQCVGKAPVNVIDVPVDLLTFAAHKFHGPKGVGGLYVRRGVSIGRQMHGGPHERERRSGTENGSGIVGMGEAARLAIEWLATDARTSLASSRDAFERAILTAIPDAHIHCAESPRLWNTTNIAFPHLEAEAILLLLSERGVCVSAGAACSSGSLDPSPVLLAMGIPEELAHGSVRFSISRETTEQELDAAAEIISAAVERLRASAPAL